MRLKERKRRESERILRNIADYESQLQDEMFKEFDQSTFNLGLQGFHNSLHITPDYLSDSSQTDADQNLYLSNALNPQSPAYQQSSLRSISNRVKTPVRINNKISCSSNSYNV